MGFDDVVYAVFQYFIPACLVGYYANTNRQTSQSQISVLAKQQRATSPVVGHDRGYMWFDVMLFFGILFDLAR